MLNEDDKVVDITYYRLAKEIQLIHDALVRFNAALYELITWSVEFHKAIEEFYTEEVNEQPLK